MHPQFCAFGEILWDCLPSGRHAGGAPFNVAAHLVQLGSSVALLSAVGQDSLGDEILHVARDKGVETGFTGRARAGLATGTVRVTLDAQANATYEIVQPVAWDEIALSPEACAAVEGAQALIYGTLAARAAHNREELGRLLALAGPLKVYDVNLRPPFADPELVLALAQQADVVKLNDDELGRLAAWVQTGSMTPGTPRDEAALAEACATLARASGAARICVTRGPDGAAFWEDGQLLAAPAPAVFVRDTVGAGDAFMAGLVTGLTRGLPRPRTLASACRLGAYVASHHGATPLLPPELIEEFRSDDA